MRRVNLLEELAKDLGYGFRMLTKSPGFIFTAVLSVALGIGANTAIFSLLNAVVLRLLPVSDPQQLVQFTYTAPLWGGKVGSAIRSSNASARGRRRSPASSAARGSGA